VCLYVLCMCVNLCVLCMYESVCVCVLCMCVSLCVRCVCIFVCDHISLSLSLSLCVSWYFEAEHKLADLTVLECSL